jgi:hypothetical protein
VGTAASEADSLARHRLLHLLCRENDGIDDGDDDSARHGTEVPARYCPRAYEVLSVLY